MSWLSNRSFTRDFGTEPPTMFRVRLCFCIPKVIVLGHARSIAREVQESLPEYSVLLPCAVSAKLWSALSGSPAVVIAGEEEWQHLRIKHGKLTFFTLLISGTKTCLPLSTAGLVVSHSPCTKATVRKDDC